MSVGVGWTVHCEANLISSGPARAMTPSRTRLASERLGEERIVELARAAWRSEMSDGVELDAVAAAAFSQSSKYGATQLSWTAAWARDSVRIAG